jgi:hypothetical protein
VLAWPHSLKAPPGFLYCASLPFVLELDRGQGNPIRAGCVPVNDVHRVGGVVLAGSLKVSVD